MDPGARHCTSTRTAPPLTWVSGGSTQCLDNYDNHHAPWFGAAPGASSLGPSSATDATQQTIQKHNRAAHLTAMAWLPSGIIASRRTTVRLPRRTDINKYANETTIICPEVARYNNEELLGGAV